MAVSQLCYRSEFCAGMVPQGEGGIIVVRVLPAKPVLGERDRASWGSHGYLRQEQAISRLLGKQPRTWWGGLSQGMLCPAFAWGLEFPWLV